MENIKLGFSLIELMITISLCMVLVGLGMVNVRSLEKTKVVAEMDLLCTACNALQQQAIATGKIQELALDTARHKYSCNGHEHALASGVYFDTALDAYGPPSAPHKQLEYPTTFKENTILFYPEGMMSAGMICFTNGKRTMLYAISSSVAHVSFLRRYYYDGNWHAIT